MKKILGIFLLLIITVVLLTVAALPAMLWLDNWLQILTAVTVYIIIVLAEVILLGKVLVRVIDALIKQNDNSDKE